jgi:spermidine synthase
MSDLLEFRSRYRDSAVRVPDGTPFLHEDEGKISLHYELCTIQSCMRKDAPDELVLDYTRAMMGFLLFQPSPEKIVMIGLGGGSLAKYCHRHIPGVDFTAVELHPEVIALRDEFQIPRDGPHFRVICADGADYIRGSCEAVDVLVVDGFDLRGQPSELCSLGFYDHCFARLRDGGVLVVNLWGGDPKYGTYTSRIREVFEGRALVINAEDKANKIVFAYKGADLPSQSTLSDRIRTLEAAHAINLQVTGQKILQRLHQCSPSGRESP